MYQREVFEPIAVKEQIIKSAIEAACMLLRIDGAIAAGTTKAPKTPTSGEDGAPDLD